MQEQNPSTPPADELQAQTATEAPAAQETTPTTDSMPSLEESLRQAELKAAEHHDANSQQGIA